MLNRGLYVAHNQSHASYSKSYSFHMYTYVYVYVSFSYQPCLTWKCLPLPPSNLGAGSIAGIVIAVLIVVFCCTVFIYCCWTRHRIQRGVPIENVGLLAKDIELREL